MPIIVTSLLDKPVEEVKPEEAWSLLIDENFPQVIETKDERFFKMYNMLCDIIESNNKSVIARLLRDYIILNIFS